MNIKYRLTLLNFLEFAIWGAYLTSMGTYLAGVGLGSNIGWFYSVQGVVSIFMPALMGILADRWMEGQRVLSLCHVMAGVFMIAASFYGYQAGPNPDFGILFALYTLSVAFFMPTIALSYSVAYSALEKAGLDTVKAFEKIPAGGILFTFSCSQAVNKDQFRMAVFTAAAMAKRKVRILHQLHQPADHPINIYHPEGEYLKGLVLYVE